MTIDLPEELARFVHEAVQTGRYARDEDVVRDALLRLKWATLGEAGLLASLREHVEIAGSMTEAEFQQRLCEAGIITCPPTPVDPALHQEFEPVEIEGEPLSETIIRERR